VAEFIINEILNDDLEFKNLVYQQVFEDYTAHFQKDEILESKFFINHPDEKIRSLAANIFTDNYKASAIWTKGGKKIETPDKTLKEDVPKAINSYKLKIIQQAIKEVDEQIKNLPKDDVELEIKLLEQKNILINTKSTLAGETGNRIIF
jgi:DNA primase